MTAWMGFVLVLLLQAPSDGALLREAKLAILDREWIRAVEECDRLIDRYPRSRLVVQARFYRARGFEGAGLEERAVSAYEAFLREHPGEGELQQDARTAAIAISRRLLDRGEEAYWRILRAGLEDDSPPVRSFAALQVSALSARRYARQAIPVLTEMVRRGSSDELRDRARIALLRLDTRALAEAESRSEGSGPDKGAAVVRRRFRERATWISIRIYREGALEVNLRVPIALGELVYRALGEEPKRRLRAEKGIDLDNFWEEMEKLEDKKLLVIRTDRERIEIRIE